MAKQRGMCQRRGIGARALVLQLGGRSLARVEGHNAPFLLPGAAPSAGAAHGFESEDCCRGRLGGRAACPPLGSSSRWAPGVAVGKRGSRQGRMMAALWR